MPTYAYHCPDCGSSFERVLSFAERDQPQTCSCGGLGKKVLGNPGFILQGDGWAGKNIRIRGQMESKNRRLGQKGKDIPTPNRLVPNVDGEEVATWEEARRLAASKGKDTSLHDALIEGGKAA